MGQVIVFTAFQAVVFIQHVNQFRESRRYVNALFVFNSLQALPDDLFDDHGVFFNIGIVFPQIQEQRHKRRLTVGGHQGVDLILDSLDPGLQFFPQPFVHHGFQNFRVHIFAQGLNGPFHKFIPAPAQVFAQMTHIHRLAAVLAGSYGSDDLGHHVAGNLEASGRFDHLPVHNGAVIQHVPDVDQAAVEDGLDKIIHIMEMKHPFFMGFGDLFRKDHPAGQVLGHFPGDQVALGRSHDGILVAVFFHNILVAVTDQRKDGFVGSIGLTHQGPAVTVNDIGLGQIELARFLKLALYNVLDILHQQAGTVFPVDVFRNFLNFTFLNAASLFYCSVCLLNGHHNFLGIKINRRTVAFNYLHATKSSLNY